MKQEINDGITAYAALWENSYFGTAAIVIKFQFRDFSMTYAIIDYNTIIIYYFISYYLLVGSLLQSI